MSVNSKMTAIADKIRALLGISGKIGLDAMADNLGTAVEACDSQAALIAQIRTALEGKAAGGSGGVVALDYISTDALKSQAIDTGIKSTSNIAYEIQYSPTGGGASYWLYQCIIGSDNYGNSYFPVCKNPTTNKVDAEYVAYSHNGVLFAHLGQDLMNVRTTLRKEGLNFIITAENGFSTTFTHSGTTPEFASDINIFLFGRGLYDYCSAKLYYCKIWDNGVLVRDFVPAIDRTVKPCLYDKVSKTYFYNEGTGDFGAGELVSG